MKLIHNYLLNRKQRVQVNHSKSLWQNILSALPQGLILVPPLFNIFLAELFFTLNNTEIAIMQMTQRHMLSLITSMTCSIFGKILKISS